MPGSNNDEDDGPPKSSFEIYRAEGESLFKNGDFKKAIECFSAALELKPGDRHCLVKRSQCHLTLGDTTAALTDAESSLTDDKTYYKGIFQKAETLYSIGDFENALVFYHRGNRLRPEFEPFRLGIQKAEEAILNSVGTSESVKLTKEGDLSSFYKQQDEGKQKQKAGFRLGVQREQKQTRKERVKPQLDNKTVKQLLGELYDDREYLDSLLQTEEQSKRKTEKNQQIRDVIVDGLNYLEKRTEFWQQQKPMYARKRDARLTAEETLSKGTPKCEAAHTKNPSEYVVRRLEKIDDAQARGDYETSLKLAERTLAVCECWTDEQVEKRQEFMAALHSYIGNAYLEEAMQLEKKYDQAKQQEQAELARIRESEESGHTKQTTELKRKFKAVDVAKWDKEINDARQKSLDNHQKDFNIGKENNFDEALSRSMDNVGRVYMNMRRYDVAAKVWQEKLQLSKTSLETAWLCHEIARCYLELKQYERVHDFGEKALRAAEEASDDGWQLSVNMLMGQADSQAGQYGDAIESFERALKFVHEGDGKKEEFIKHAIEEASNKILQAEQRSARDENSNEEAAPVNERPKSQTANSQPTSPRQQQQQPQQQSQEPERQQSAKKSDGNEAGQGGDGGAGGSASGGSGGGGGGGGDDGRQTPKSPRSAQNDRNIIKEITDITVSEVNKRTPANAATPTPQNVTVTVPGARFGF